MLKGGYFIVVAIVVNSIKNELVFPHILSKLRLDNNFRNVRKDRHAGE